MVREDWFCRLKELLSNSFEVLGFPIPESIRISCGWPSQKALSRRDKAIGECWSPSCSKDHTVEIFISPFIDDPVEAGAILLHELVHAAVGNEHGHRGPFKHLAVSLGLSGKMTATVASTSLKDRLNVLITQIGEYPHKMLDFELLDKRKKEGTRLLKVVCPSCKYTVRTTQKWLNIGLPTCYCGTKMEVK